MPSNDRFLVAVSQVLAALTISVLPLPARAQDAQKAQCASAYEKSQELRSKGSLSEARGQLVLCARDVCPAFVQSDCAQWLAEVERDMPTLVFSAKDKDGNDVTAVRVFVDGELIREELDGKPVIVNPGEHVLRFELEGAEPVEQKVSLHASEKDHPIQVSFAPSTETPAPAPAVVPEDVSFSKPEPPPPKKQVGPGPLRPYAFVAGGVGAAGILGFVVLGAMGHSQEADLKKTCSPHCPQSDVDAVKTKYLLADVSLGLGIAGLAGGVALFFLSQPKPEDSEKTGRLEFDVRASRDTAYGTVSGRF